MTVPRTWTERRLQEALYTPFAMPVTAYLTDVLISSCCAVGGIHHDARPAKRGAFPDGHRVRTSDIHSVSREGHFWVIRTARVATSSSAFMPREGKGRLPIF